MDQFRGVYTSYFHLFFKQEDFIKDQIPQKGEFTLPLRTWNLVPNYNFFTKSWYFWLNIHLIPQDLAVVENRIGQKGAKFGT